MVVDIKDRVLFHYYMRCECRDTLRIIIFKPVFLNKLDILATYGMQHGFVSYITSVPAKYRGKE